MATKTKTYVVTKGKTGEKTTIKVKEGKLIRVDTRGDRVRIRTKNKENVISATTVKETNGMAASQQPTTSMASSNDQEQNQSIASREDLQRAKQQSLLLERRDYESAYRSSIPERDKGTIILPDTAREERIRKENIKKSDYEKKISAAKVSESRIEEERKGAVKQFFDNPSPNKVVDLLGLYGKESVAETIPAGIRTLGAFELTGRGVVKIGEGIISGETKRGSKVTEGVALLVSARKEVTKETISAIPYYAVEISSVTLATEGLISGGRINKKSFIPESPGKASIVTDVSTGVTTTRTTTVGTAYDANIQTFLGRSAVVNNRVVPITRGVAERSAIITETVSTPDIRRAGQVLETGDVESVTTIKNLVSGKENIVSTSYGRQRGEIVDELIFERNVVGGERAVSFVSQESVPTGTGSELYTVRGQTITSRGERSGFLLIEERIISDVGSTRTSVGSVRNIEYPKIETNRVGRVRSVRLGKKGQVSVSRPQSATSFEVSEPSFSVSTRSVGVVKPRFSSATRSVIIDEAGYLSKNVGVSRIVGLSRSTGFVDSTDAVRTVSANKTAINSLGVNNSLSNTISTGVSQPIVESISGSVSSTVGVITNVSIGRGSSRIVGSSLDLPKPPKPLIPVGKPNINLGSGYDIKFPLKRYKGGTKSGVPPSLAGSILGVGVKTKPGRTYSGLELRR